MANWWDQDKDADVGSLPKPAQSPTVAEAKPKAPEAPAPQANWWDQDKSAEPVVAKPEPTTVATPAKDSESWDITRGAKTALMQTPQLAYGVTGLVGATAEELTGYGSSVRDWGLQGYKDWEQAAQPMSKETDNVTVAWERAKKGDIGALVDWAQYGVGYALGQLGETAAIAFLGGLAGGAAASEAGPLAVPAAGAGAVLAAAGKTGFKAIAENLVKKAIAKQAVKIAEEQSLKAGVKLTAEELAQKATSSEIKKLAGKEIGSSIAIFGNSVGMELGSIYGEAEAQAASEGRQLNGGDLARIWGTGLATGGLEGLTDKVGLDLLKGKFASKLPSGRLAGAAVAGAVGILGEGTTEAIQTAGERFGAGKDITSDDAVKEYINSAALGALGGGVIGGAGGFISGNPKDDATAKAKVSSEIHKEIAPETSKLVGSQADAEIRKLELSQQAEEEKKKAQGAIPTEKPPTTTPAQDPLARIEERQGKPVEPAPVAQGTRIEAAAYMAPDNTVYYGKDHLEAMGKALEAGKITQEEIDAKQEPTSRETKEFGFSTEADPFIGRSQAEVVATGSGQMLVEKPASGLLHSNEVAQDAFPQQNVEAAPKVNVATRTIADAIKDKDTFIYNGQRGAITVEDGVSIFRPFGTQEKYEVPVNPNQNIGEIEGVEWARKGQTRIQPVESKPEIASIVEQPTEVAEEEVESATNDFDVPAALDEIRKSQTLNDLADLFDTGDSKVVQEGKRAKKVSSTPEFYSQAQPKQLGLAKRLIDSALRIIDASGLSEDQKSSLAQPYLLLDQDITNYENNPAHQKYKASILKEVLPTGEVGPLQPTQGQAPTADEGIEQRAKAEAKRLEGVALARKVETEQAVLVPTTEGGTPTTTEEDQKQNKIKNTIDQYGVTEEEATSIVENKPFKVVTNKEGALPSGWFYEIYGDQTYAIPQAIVEKRLAAQGELRRLSIVERAALSGILTEQRLVNETDAKSYISDAKAQGFTEDDIAAASTEAQTKWNERFGDNGNARQVAGDVSTPVVNVAAEEAERATKPKVTGGNALPSSKLFGMTAREALQYLSDQNLGASDAEREGRPLNLSQLMQRAASVLAKASLRILDADFIIKARGGARAYRANEGFIRLPATVGGSEYFENPATLVHEVGHTLTADAIRKYVFDRAKSGARGISYAKALDKALADPNTPDQIKRLVSLYKQTLDELGITEQYLGAGGLADVDATRSQKSAWKRRNPIINKLTGKQIGWNELYALSNLDEFVAQSWSSPAFQDMLKGIKVKNQPSIFDQFVRIIRDLFGLDSDTMAAAVIDASYALAQLEAPATGGTIDERIAATAKARKFFGGRLIKPSPPPQSQAVIKLDADYLAAVERGDMETAQRMVDEKLKDVRGNRPANIVGKWQAKRDSLKEGSSEWYIASYAENDFDNGRYYRTLEEAWAGSKGRAYDWAMNDDAPYSVFKKIEAAQEAPPAWFKDLYWERIDPEIRDKDGILDHSVKAVRRDSQGNVIPLSQRFNPEEANINYAPQPDIVKQETEAERNTIDAMGEVLQNADSYSLSIAGDKPLMSLEDIIGDWFETIGGVNDLRDSIVLNTHLDFTAASTFADAIFNQYNIQKALIDLRQEVEGRKVAQPSGETRPYSFVETAAAEIPKGDKSKIQKVYEVLSNNVSSSEATEALNALTLDEAISAVKDMANGIKSGVRTMMAQITYKRLMEERQKISQEHGNRSQDYIDIREKHIDLFDWISDYAKDLGQGVQAFARFSDLGPDGILRHYEKTLKKIVKTATQKYAQQIRKIQKAISDGDMASFNEALTRNKQGISNMAEKMGKADAKAMTIEEEGNKIAQRVARTIMRDKPVKQTSPLSDLVNSHIRNYDPDFAAKAQAMGVKQENIATIEAAAVKVRDQRAVAKSEREKFVANQQAFKNASIALARENKYLYGERPTIWENYQAMFSERFAKALMRDSNKKPPASLMVFTNRLTQNLIGFIPETERATSTPQSVQAFIEDALNNKEKYQQAFAQARRDMSMKVADLEQKASTTEAATDAYLEAVAAKEFMDELAPQIKDFPVSPKTIDRFVNQRAKQLEISLTEEFNSWYKASKQGRVDIEQSIKNRLLQGRTGVTNEMDVMPLNIPEADVAKLARYIVSDFKQKAEERRKKALQRFKTPKKTVEGEVETQTKLEKLFELINMGVITDEEAYGIIADKYKLPQYSKKFADELYRAAEELQGMPDQLRKKLKTRDLMAMITKEKGFSASELGTGFIYANMLSSPDTHIVNIIDTLINNFANGIVDVIATGDTARLEGILKGYKKGWVQAVDTFKTGLRIGMPGFEAQDLQVLESNQFGVKGGVHMSEFGVVNQITKAILESKPAGILNYAKYIGRLLEAQDAANFAASQEGQRYAEAAFRVDQAAKIAGTTLTKKERKINISVMLNSSDKALIKARQQAIAEGYTGTDAEYRAIEITEENISPEIKDKGFERALKDVYRQKPMGTAGALADTFFNFINQRVESPLARSSIKLIVSPFVVTPVNIFNKWLDWSPYGFKRAFYGSGNWMSEKYKVEAYEKGSIERRVQMLKASSSVLVMGVVAALVQAGAIALTGRGPNDEEERKDWLARGNKPYRVNVGGVDFNFTLTPWAIPLSIMANYMNWKKYNMGSDAGAMERLIVATTFVPSITMELPFMSGVADLFDLINPRSSASAEKRFEKFVGGKVGMFYPNAFRYIDRLFDPAVYKSSGIRAMFIDQTPFVRRSGGKLLNLFGEQIGEGKSVIERFSGRVVSFPQASKESLLLEKFDAYPYIESPNKESVVTRDKDGTPVKIQMTQEQYEKFAVGVGQQFKQYILSNYNMNKEYSEKDKEYIKKNILKTYGDLRKTWRRKVGSRE